MARLGGGNTEEEKSARDDGQCSSCGALIYWVQTPAGARMPLDRGRETRVCYVDGQWRTLGAYKSHFATCPNAAQHRGKAR